MAELLKQEIHGAFGCTIAATPATIFDQFEHVYTASMFYDFVLVDALNHCIELHTSGHHPRRLMKENFERLKVGGIAFDPYDVFNLPSEQLSEKKFKELYLLSADRSPNDRITLNGFIAAARSARMDLDTFVQAVGVPQRISGNGIVSIPLDKIDEHDLVSKHLDFANTKLRNFMYELAATNSGLTLDSGRMLSRDPDRNDELRPLLQDGKIPLGGKPTTLRPLTPGDELRTFQLVLRSVPFPVGMPLDEFIDFRNSKSVRSSVRSFRKLASDLVGGQSPARYVVEEITDQYERYKLEVDKVGKKATISNIKFIVSNLAGVVEDIVKFRIESLSKRPFEIAEYLLDRSTTKSEYENSPFHFIYEKDTSVPRLEPNVRF